MLETANKKIGSVVLSTSQVAAKEQFDFWHSLVIRHYVDAGVQLLAQSPLQSGYSGHLRRTTFGGYAIDQVSAETVRVNRTPSAVRRSPSDYYQIAVLLEGEGIVMQDGRTAHQTTPGDFLFIDTERPYIFDFLGAPTRQAFLQVPKDLADDRFTGLDKLTAITVNSNKGIGRLASQMLVAMSQNEEARCDQTSLSVVSSALSLAVTALREHTGSDSALRPTEVLLEDAKSYILRHFNDADAVTPYRIAAAINVSERYLFRLFEQEQSTPARWVHKIRLEKARRMLEDPVNMLSIKDVSSLVGFSSPAHFSRTFSARFGRSPREARVKAHQPMDRAA